jgi:iron complex transport system substrate-binding protein
VSRSITIFAALAALLISGCGSAGGSSTTTAATRTVVDARGTSVEVPSTPSRVIALSEPTLDGALALGVTPIATTAGRGQSSVPAYLAARAEDIDSVGALGQPSLERIAALHPDLILVDGTSINDDTLIRRLRSIAPTVYVSKNGADWRAAFTTEASVLGRAARGRTLLKAFDDRAAEVRASLGANAGAQVSIIRWSGIGLPATLKQELSASRVLDQVGLTRPASQQGRGPGHSVPLSLENLDQLDGDWIFFAALGSGGPGDGGGGAKAESAGVTSSRDAIAIASGQSGWDRLGAVRAQHVVPVDGSAWGSAGGLLAEQVVLDDVQRALGDGS